MNEIAILTQKDKKKCDREESNMAYWRGINDFHFWFGSQAGTPSTEPHQPGLISTFERHQDLYKKCGKTKPNKQTKKKKMPFQVD